MTDLNAVARQWKLEAEAARLGAERLRERTRADEQREYSSGTLWGRKLVNQQIGNIAKQIRETERKVRLGTACAGGVRIMDVLQAIEPEVLAAIAAKRTLDLIGMGKTTGGKHANTYAAVCISIGAAVEAEARFRWYEKTAPEEFHSIKHHLFKATTGTTQKLTIASVMMNRAGFKWDAWSRPKKHSIGAWLLNCVAQAVNWFRTTHRNLNNKRNALHLVEISPELTDLRAVIMGLAELQAPLAWPMVTEPAQWSNEEKGGYLTNELRNQHHLVRGPKVARTLGKAPLDMLNTLQGVAYRINPVVLNLMHHLNDKEQSLGSFVLEANAVPIPRPNTEDKDEIKAWRRERTQQENRNASLRGRRYRTLETLTIANRFASEPEIYIPWSYDWRGRVYPIPTFMSPQGSDMEKALYTFAKARPVTEDAKRWLAIQVANTAGKDKLTLEDRVQWTKDNESIIHQIAVDPIGSLPLLEAFDEPWCGLAACDEYYHCVMLGDRTETRLPVATDATCSGLQHLAAMTLDRSTGVLVNVAPAAPGEPPQDAYKAVLNLTLEMLRAAGKDDLADWGEDIGRALAKRVVMTVPYAAEEHSNRGYILKAIKDHEEEKPKADQRRVTGEELTAYTKTMLKAMKQIVPGPLSVMDWAKGAARDFFINDPDAQEIRWTSPSGFPVIQDKREVLTTRVKTQLLGDCVWTTVGNGFGGPKVSKHRSGIMPNFIHSCDAALLHNSFAGFDQPFTLIHDSILTTATDMGYMSEVIRDEFVKIYEKLPLTELARALNTEVPAGMIIGDLEIHDTRTSVYFFC